MDSWDNSDDEEKEAEKPEGTLTANQLRQKMILDEKCDELVLRLLDEMSSKNQHDKEKCLNSYIILLEFCENNHTFNILTKPSSLGRLTQICCEGEVNQQNLAYALNLLQIIVAEFSNSDKEITDSHKMEIFKLFQEFFVDMTYNCLMILYDQPTESYINQTQLHVNKIGLVRLRAMELLKTLF